LLTPFAVWFYFTDITKNSGLLFIPYYEIFPFQNCTFLKRRHAKICTNYISANFKVENNDFYFCSANQI